ncbi:transposase [Cohnella lupini]|uniref:Transposase n=1 Tax=Cohnella lupini TaxID=1294267 RepID=A0A3D9HZE5_9BACL|nr:transposase [Cohnella lupini]
MHFNQNQRITQITSSTLIVGVDIAKFKHVARAQDFRGVEFGKPISFENSLEGFEIFVNWFRKIMSEHGCEDIVVGMEPTTTSRMPGSSHSLSKTGDTPYRIFHKASMQSCVKL